MGVWLVGVGTRRGIQRGFLVLLPFTARGTLVQRRLLFIFAPYNETLTLIYFK